MAGHEAELGKLAGERATVKGSLMAEMVIVESVAAAKKVTPSNRCRGNKHPICSDHLGIVSLTFLSGLEGGNSSCSVS